MKKRIDGFGMGTPCAICMMLGACAWLPNKAAAPIQETDYAKVSAIEAAARVRGVSIYWYRYPTKPAESNLPPAAAPGTPHDAH